MEIQYTPSVVKFINGLPNQLLDRLRRTIQLLEENRHLVRMPLSKPLGGGLFELRIVGAVHIRILYFFYKDQIFIVHGFFKKTRKIESDDIHFARKKMKDILANI